MPRHERGQGVAQATLEEALSGRQVVAMRRIVGVAAATLTAVAAVIAALLIATYR